MQGGRKGLLELLQLLARELLSPLPTAARAEKSLAALRALVEATFGVLLGAELVKAGVGHRLGDQGLLRRQQRARSQVRRAAFRCGGEVLDRFLAQQTGQKRRRTGPGCLRQPATSYAAPLPTYPVPCFRMARLAWDLSCRGQGMASLLLGLPRSVAKPRDPGASARKF